ncbi:type IV toxin-antitoxin system AbiEi family antitoxin domain-containing protein [Castellaniella daejeonensis]|uniref:Type IV toxin-antitoxin system AbiEi family antitoxin domain-containing protein n=1 Tax=Castellaniella daejeonensis TaxID=659013 RepID=A0ABP3DE26_9BURK
MNKESNFHIKTLGPRAAQLLVELNEQRRSTFNVADVASITGLSPSAARNLVHKAQQRGLVTRLKPGLYNLVPFELGRATEHVDSPYIIARELAGTAPYFLSHGTAFELHRMVTQPNFTIYASSTRRVRPQTVGGYDFRFVLITDKQEFGVMKHWIDKQRFVMISDMERTIIDGLRHPAYVGGITEVAKGLWMKRDTLNIRRLMDYAQRLGVGAVIRRLGYLLEHYELADAATLEPLLSQLTASYLRLDPLLPAEGPYLSRWKLQLNVPAEELDSIRFT